MSLCVGAYTLLGFVATTGVGIATPESIETYVSIHGSPYDSELVRFEEPMGSYGIQYDPHENIRLFFEHQSSPVTCKDHPGLNMLGVKVLAPVTEDVTLYSGVAVHDESTDSNNRLQNPILINGIEWGDDIKLYGEYINDTYDFDGGRVSAGVKVLFR